ncbi:hypothetical protein L916_07678, partial [Phytophthora nicotianae]
ASHRGQARFIEEMDDYACVTYEQLKLKQDEVTVRKNVKLTQDSTEWIEGVGFQVNDIAEPSRIPKTLQ